MSGAVDSCWSMANRRQKYSETMQAMSSMKFRTWSALESMSLLRMRSTDRFSSWAMVGGLSCDMSDFSVGMAALRYETLAEDDERAW